MKFVEGSNTQMIWTMRGNNIFGACNISDVVNYRNILSEFKGTKMQFCILVASNIVYLLQLYSTNITKRAIKTPKLYFLDTGLAAYLTKWNTPEVLKNGAMAGAFFETFVISEIIKSYYNNGILEPPLYFYRDKDMHEIDLLIEDSGTLYPLEMKKHADPSQKDIDAFSLIDKIPGIKRGPGGVICMYDNLITLQGEDKAIPINYL